MSRVGRSPIDLPNEVKVIIKERQVLVEGPKGKLDYILLDGILVEVEGAKVFVKAESDDKSLRAFHGLTRALINNMIIGVKEGYKKELDIIGVGYKAILKGKQLNIQVGFSHPVDVDVWEDLTVSTPSATKIIIEGINKQRVGEFAAQIRRIKPPEPYKGKGIRYTDEVVRRKAGKAMSK